MRSIVRHTYGPEGIAYLREYLEANEGFGKRLGPALSHRELETGTTSAFVPSDAPAQQRASFRRGGLFSGACEVSSGSAALKEWLVGLLTGAVPFFVCVEDALSRRTDPVQQSPFEGRTRLFCGNDVYWYATTPEGATQLLKPSATWTPDVAIVAPPPAGLSNVRDGQSVSPDMIQASADAAVAVIVGAWDADGWLIWEPADTAHDTTAP